MSNKRLFFLLKLAISIGLVAYVIHKTGLDTSGGRSKIWDILKGVNPLFFGLSLLVGVLLNVTSSWRWRILLLSKNLDVSLWRLLAYYYIGRFFNMFMPTSMGGDVARVWDLGKHTGDNYEALASVFMERFIGMVVLAGVSGIVLLFHDTHLPIITNSLLFVIALVVFVLLLVFNKGLFNFFQRVLARIHPLFGQLFEKLERVHDAIYSYKNNKATLAYVVLISTSFYALAVINVWISARAFSVDVAFYDMLLAVPAIMLIMNLPVSIGGLGLMEAAYTTTFALFGYSPSLALSTALLMRFKTIVNALIGAAIHVARLRTNPDKPPQA